MNTPVNLWCMCKESKMAWQWCRQYMCICRQINFFHTWLDQCNDTLQSLWQIRTIPAQSDSCKVRMAQRRREKKRYTGKNAACTRPSQLLFSVHSARWSITLTVFISIWIFFFIAIEAHWSRCFIHTWMWYAHCSVLTQEDIGFYVFFFSRSLRNFSFRLIFTLSIDKI